MTEKFLAEMRKIDELDGKEYLKRSKHLYKSAMLCISSGLYSTIIGAIFFFVELLITLGTQPDGLGYVLSCTCEGEYIWVNSITGINYFLLSMGLMSITIGALLSHTAWHYIGLGLSAVNYMNSNASADANKGVKKENSHTTSNTSKNAETKKTQSHTKQDLQSNQYKSTATDTADDYYYDIQCPHCHSDLSIIKNHTYKDGFECPYCSKKISI